MLDVALLSPVNPFEPLDGHRLAVASDVHAILDNGLNLGVLTFLYGSQQPTAVSQSQVRYFSVGRGSFPIRFLRGLVGRVPPSSERLYTRQSIAGVRKALQEWKPKYAIIDDVSMAAYIPHVRDVVPNTKIVLRTHNVMCDVRGEQLGRTTGPLRFAVKLDSDRYRRFEREALAGADSHWAITQTDADRIQEIYGKPSGYLSVSIPIERYAAIDVTEGRNNHFVHVGTLDFRRRADLESFLQRSWPQVRAIDPQAAITFAGSLHGRASRSSGRDLFRAGRR